MHDNDMILYRKNHYEMFLSNHIKRYLLTDVAKRDPTLENYPNEKKKKNRRPLRTGVGTQLQILRGELGVGEGLGFRGSGGWGLRLGFRVQGSGFTDVGCNFFLVLV